MPRPVSIALVATLCLASTVRAEDKLPPGMKPILDKAVRDVRTNREAFDKANKKPFDEARKALEALSTKLIKDGKTDEAGVVLKQVGTLEADVLKSANAPTPVAGAGGPAQQKPLLDRLEGKWTHPNEPTIIQIEPNGAIRQYFKTDGKLFRQGQIQAMADGTAEGLMDGEKFKISEAVGDRLAVEIWQPTGKQWGHGMVLTRTK